MPRKSSIQIRLETTGNLPITMMLISDIPPRRIQFGKIRVALMVAEMASVNRP